MSDSESSVASLDISLECNFDVLKSTKNDSNDDEDLLDLSDTEITTISSNNPYIKDLLATTKLKILQIDAVKQAYYSKEIGLFRLFLKNSFFECIRKWTNEVRAKKGQGLVSQEKFKAYVGIEIAMSIIKLNDISDYWSKKQFLGNKDIAMLCQGTILKRLEEA